MLYEPIVSIDDFAKVQKQIAKRARRPREEESSSSIFVKQMILHGRATADSGGKNE